MALRPHQTFWPGKDDQSLEACLSDFLTKETFYPTGIQKTHVRIGGSCIEDDYPDVNLKDHELGDQGNRTVFWGCGLREKSDIRNLSRQHCDFLAVRGPLTRAMLGLGIEVPTADPVLLLPAIYQPASSQTNARSLLLVPDANDSRSDDELCSISGSTDILRPVVHKSDHAIQDFIDQILKPEFVLCGCLSSAMIAAAYGRPFAFWDSGKIRAPFQWEDFAASIQVPCAFQFTFDEASRFYREVIETKVSIPLLWPLLVAAPFPVRTDVMARACQLDVQRHGLTAITQSISSKIPSILRDSVDANNQHQENLETTCASQAQKIVELQKSNVAKEDEIARLNQSVAESWLCLAELKRSWSWRITLPYRLVADRAKKVLRSPSVPRLRSAISLLKSPRAPRSFDPALSRRILVSDYRIPRADASAGEQATVGILRDLCALGYDVVFLPNDMAPFSRYEAVLEALGVEVVTLKSGFTSSRDYISAKGNQFGALYVFRVEVAESILTAFRRASPRAKVIFHAPDLAYLRKVREAELHSDSKGMQLALAAKERELAIMRSSDHVVVVSPDEVRLLKTELPDVPISLFPVLYAPILPVSRDFAERSHLFFIAGFSHPPNVNAVLWFATEVWPIVHDALPGAEFHIVGAEAPPSVVALGEISGIRFVGFVQNLNPLLGMFRLGVAPLLYGAGIKGKVAITMGAGIPCVCTKIAAEGMGIQDGIHALVADEPKKFAEAVISLYQDAALWVRLSRNGQELVRERFGDEANRAHLLKVLDNARVLPLNLFAEYCSAAAPSAIPAPAQDEDVDVSIIVPVYNKWALTRACLTSVIQTSVGSDVRYEIILADDGSTDETVSAAQIFPGLRIARTTSNMGFLRNCNNAAKHARGHYLLLLNNDTVVLPGWLEALFRTIEADPSAAIVGSKLLYPDGGIQEAGGVLFSDGSGMNAGRGGHRDDPQVNLAREVDYISGASIMIRASFWSAVGGFDERYKHAYCEDSDLAMSARSRGMRVLYEPHSEVIHFEHGSYEEQNETLQKHNNELLFEKWKDDFKSKHLSHDEWHRKERGGGVERIRLEQHALQIQVGQQRLESGPLSGFVGVVGLLSQGSAKSPGVDGELGDIDAVGRRP